jgi:predicted MFS family arabinose efflux permease
MGALKTSSLCEGMASCLILSFLPLYVRASLGEPSYLVISFIPGIPALLLFVMNNFWGAFVDATGGFRLAERLGLLGYCLCLAALCAVRSAFGAIVVVVGFSLLYGALRPTLLSHATILQEKAKASAISGILLFQSVGWLVLGVIYGALYERNAPWTVWLILGPPALLSLVVTLLMPRWVRNPDIGTGAGTFGEAWRRAPMKVLLGDLGQIYRNRELFRLCLVVFIVSSSNWCFFGMFSLIYTEEMGGGDDWLGWSISLSTATAIAVFTPLGRLLDRRGARIGLFGAIVLYILVYSAIALSRDHRIVSALFIIPVYPIFLVSANALAAEATHTKQRAGGIGVMGGVLAISVLVGCVLGGSMGDAYGLRSIIYTSVAISSLSLITFVLLVGLKRHVPRASERGGGRGAERRET